METQRHTKQREIVCKTVRRLYHPSAEEVFAAIRNEGLDVSRATVYRTLTKLALSGDIRKIPLANEGDRFDGNPNFHAHFVCERCGEIVDLFDAQEPQPPALSDGYEVKRCESVYYGLCGACVRGKQN